MYVTLAGQITLDDSSRERAMFAPLDVHSRRAMSTPVRVKNLPVPVRPHVGGLTSGRVVADPDDFFVGRDRERILTGVATEVVRSQDASEQRIPRGKPALRRAV